MSVNNNLKWSPKPLRNKPSIPGLLLSITTSSVLQRWTEVSSLGKNPSSSLLVLRGRAPKAGIPPSCSEGQCAAAGTQGAGRGHPASGKGQAVRPDPHFPACPSGTLSPRQTHTARMSTCAPSTHGSGGAQWARRAHTAPGPTHTLFFHAWCQSLLASGSCSALTPASPQLLKCSLPVISLFSPLTHPPLF